MRTKTMCILEKRIEIHNNLFNGEITEISTLESYNNLDSLLLYTISEIERRNKHTHRLIFYKKKVQKWKQ